MLYRSGRLYKTKKFSNPIDVGDPVTSAKVYSSQDVDELILLNIGRDQSQFNKFVDVVNEIAKICFVPLTVGGGIRSICQAEKLINNGADKIVVNSITYTCEEKLSLFSEQFGKQAVIACVDFKTEGDNYLRCVNGLNPNFLTESYKDHIEKLIENGVGEIILQSIDNDGMMNGLHEKILSIVGDISTTPVILAGGVGTFNDLKIGFSAGASGIACGSLFNFGDNNPIRARSFLKMQGVKLKNI